MENNCINISFALFLINLMIYWINIAFKRSTVLYKLGNIINVNISLLLTISLILRWIQNSYFPLSNLYESLIFLTWGLSFLQVILEQQNKRSFIGAITTPIGLFTLGFASLSLPENMKQASPLVPALRSNWLMMHVSVMMISYATLILGSLLSILFLVLYNIKNKTNTNLKLNYATQQLSRITLLQSIDNLSYRVIGLGFPLLTIGIIAGAVWANEAWGSYWSWDPKETWALITWLVFAAYLHSRLNKEWQGQKPAILASIGFVIVWICYLGVNFLGQGLHSYGWFL
uniref:Cytochrome c biogenesis protein CcsA n=1 Tax=Gracilaria vermiculophylla TaxID=2608709 RepID=A0A345U8V0_9FLOR|nr:heme attachment to plastid cytochrome c [Gracilaria vermiculophylla]AXI96886.1 heme attachment to plastid cytochrome c [Gracilaria vermiculophylla]QXU75099.1 heme attachment to plastid cytochrome c [Gracilaria vermiculophylla]WDZ67927.1 heme attachment to plastid cytochrome c [Gracilaria vermiculophylla]